MEKEGVVLCVCLFGEERGRMKRFRQLVAKVVGYWRGDEGFFGFECL